MPRMRTIDVLHFVDHYKRLSREADGEPDPVEALSFHAALAAMALDILALTADERWNIMIDYHSERVQRAGRALREHSAS